MPHYNLIVLTNPVDGREDEYNDWYTNVHLDDVLKVAGIVAAQRFRLTNHQRCAAPHPWKYLAVYECETDDVRNVISGLRERSGTSEMPLSDAMADERLVYFFEPITERKTTAS